MDPWQDIPSEQIRMADGTTDVLITCSGVEQTHTSSDHSKEGICISSMASNTGAVPKKPFYVEVTRKTEIKSTSNNWSRNASSTFATEKDRKPHCTFCFDRNYPPSFYKNHFLKDENGFISCPILRKYVCRYSHTNEDCSVNKESYINSLLQAQSDATYLYLNTVSFYFLDKEEARMHPSTSLQDEEDTLESPIETSCTDAIPIQEINKKKKKCCKFCYKSKKPARIYSSHSLRDENGVLECRYIKQYVCDICGATGDNGHTRKYCPQNTYEDLFKILSENLF